MFRCQCPGGNLLSSRTLDRDKGLKLNDEIVGGVPPRHAGHHQISINIANNYPVMHKASDIGYNINNGSNGIALPTDINMSRTKDLLMLLWKKNLIDYRGVMIMGK